MTTTAYSFAWLVQQLRIVLVGLLVGLVAVAFQHSLDRAAQLREWLVSHAGEHILRLGVSIAITLVTAGVAVWLVARWCPEAAGSGIPNVKALAEHPRPMRWVRLLFIKFTSGTLSIGGGLALGREGPTIQMGAALGEMLAVPGGITPEQKRELLVVGAGAGLAGAFNAPLAGAMVIFEERMEHFRPATCVSALLATLCADGVSRWFNGQSPQLGAYGHPAPELAFLPCFLLLGWLGGLLGVVFNQTLLGLMRVRRRRDGWMLVFPVALLVGVIGWMNASWISGGDAIIQQARTGELGMAMAIFLLVVRFYLTIGGYATGVAGGLFAPMLVLGALLGKVIALSMPAVEPQACVLVGMAALFTGIVRAPLTGVLLIVEMAGAHALTWPLIAASVVAKGTADALGDQPIYDALLAQQRATEQQASHHPGK